jgi:hypothetical protein
LQVLLINTGVGDRLVNERTRELLLEEPDNSGYVPPVRVGQAVKWSGILELKQRRMYRTEQNMKIKNSNDVLGPEADSPAGTLVVVNHFKPVKQVTWHTKVSQ